MMFTLIFIKENNCGNLTIVCFNLVKILLSTFMSSLLSLREEIKENGKGLILA